MVVSTWQIGKWCDKFFLVKNNTKLIIYLLTSAIICVNISSEGYNTKLICIEN